MRHGDTYCICRNWSRPTFITVPNNHEKLHAFDWNLMISSFKKIHFKLSHRMQNMKWIDGLLQSCSISIANALDIPPYCTKLSICLLLLTVQLLNPKWSEINTMAADALVPCVIRSSETMVLTMQNERVFVFRKFFICIDHLTAEKWKTMQIFCMLPKIYQTQ